MLEAISQPADICSIDFTLLGGATFIQPPMPNSTLKFSGLSFMKDFKTWSSCNTDAQVVEDLIARAADTLASLRVDGSHVDCLRVLAQSSP